MKKYIAEMIGTMVLVLMGCGSAVFAGSVTGTVGAGVGTVLSLIHIYDATNIRLREASLSYRFKPLFKNFVKDLTLSVTGRNCILPIRSGLPLSETYPENDFLLAPFHI